MEDLARTLAERLPEIARRHSVPGAQAAVLTPDGIVEAATGVLNVRTGLAATPESVFQIGSITKVWTATLVMQLVDEGLLDLDTPVVEYLPDFRVADPELTRAVTSRHLLSHTSGIDGDLFLDTGRGDDALERYVAGMAGLARVHPLGVVMSYSNSGYSLLGRLVEVLRGATWDAVLRERLLTPLGLTRAGTFPEEALLQGAAVGHETPPGEEPKPVPVWGIFRSSGPAGLIHATAAEVLAFARMHLEGGVAADGARVLSAESAAAMRRPQIEVPDPWLLGTHWGLGWFLNDWQGKQVFGHDGDTLGQHSFLRVFPDSGVAVAASVNGGNGLDFDHDLLTEVVVDLVGASPRPYPEPVDGPVDPAVVRARTGTYAREGVSIVVEEREGQLLATATLHSTLQPDQPPMELPLRPTAERDLFVTRFGGDSGPLVPVRFLDVEGAGAFVHLGARTTPKVV